MSLVLVIDDEQSFLAMSLALSGAGHEVICAESGEEGLVQVAQRRPDIILLDIMMPGMSGLETLKMIRSRPESKSIPIVMVSGVRPRVKSADQKWDWFLSKPFSLAEVLSVIKKFVP